MKKRIKQKVVDEVDRPDWEQEALEIFQAAGWGDDACWLMSLVLPVVISHSDRERAPDELAALPLKVIARAWQEAGPLPDRDRALLMAYVRLCGCGGKHGFLGRTITSDTRGPDDGVITTTAEQRRELAREFRAHGADFEGALVRTGWPGDYSEGDSVAAWLRDRQHGVEATGQLPPMGPFCPAIVPLQRLLVDDARLDLTKVVDEGELSGMAVSRWPRDFGASSHRLPPSGDHELLKPDSPRSMAAWVAGLGPSAMLCLLTGLESRPDKEVGAVALGARQVIEDWLTLGVGHRTFFGRASGVLGPATRPWFDLLHRRQLAAGAMPCTPLRRAWLWFAWCAFDADRPSWQVLEAQVQKSVLTAANEEISRARKILARAGSSAAKAQEHQSDLDRDEERPAAEEFAWARDHLTTCTMVLFERGGVWRGLKPMLLAWRALTAPAVARDLRYWPEPGREEPPGPWCELVAWPINLFHHVVGREQASDPLLTSLRGEMAAFCLERLGDRVAKEKRKETKTRTDDEMIERSPEWRYCLIRAACSLAVNPEGKGHRILHKCTEIDPDDDVREAARDGYERLRRNVGLPEGVSPRRAVMSALWWMRQAHLLGLGIEPDRDGAQRTRVKELSRTKDQEHRDSRPNEQ